MRIFLLAWIALAILVLIVAQQTSDVPLGQLGQAFVALSIQAKLLIGAVMLLAGWLVGFGFWQAGRMSRQDRALAVLQGRLGEASTSLGTLDKVQEDTEAVVRQLGETDPEQMMASLQKRLSDAEQRTSAQHSHNEGLDMQQRIDDIRQRQQALRERLGEVIEKRRAIEPVFGELRERQRVLERTLGEAETDDTGTSVGDRLLQLNEFAIQSQTRLTNLQDALGNLVKLRDDLTRQQGETSRLKSPVGGIESLIAEVRSLRDGLTGEIAALEVQEGEKLPVRVAAYLDSKQEADRRIASLNECLATFTSIRKDLVELSEHERHIARSLAAVETDEHGKPLGESLRELHEFIMHSRTRLTPIQDSLVTLAKLTEDLNGCLTDLAPLQAPVGGVAAVLSDVRGLRDRINGILDQLERDGDLSLRDRVTSYVLSKQDSERRIAALGECFANLDTVRGEIAQLFTALTAKLDSHARPRPDLG